MQSAYDQTLEYLYAKLPMFSRTGKAALKPGLDNILALLAALGNPHHKFRSVHVAGTNGKGSVSHGLAAILADAGYKTGLYTSPHLVDMRERIRIDGREIPEDRVVDFVEKTKPLIDVIHPSFFEIMVAAAFLYFAAEGVDIAVIETGLGGRLDSTNVIIPMLSIITNIGLDHTDLLGDTLEQIAAEKAGIIKPGVPVIIGKTQAETEHVFRGAAKAAESDILFADHRYTVRQQTNSGREATYTARKMLTGEQYGLNSDLRGLYQQENIGTILTAADSLRDAGLQIPIKGSLQALLSVTEKTGLRGRYEILKNAPVVVADVAHNSDGLRPVVAQFLSTAASRHRIIVGFVRDKDVEAALGIFPATALFYWCNADLPRALPAAELAAMAAGKGLQGEAYASVREAVRLAMADSEATDALLITGSFFVVGEALEALAR